MFFCDRCKATQPWNCRCCERRIVSSNLQDLIKQMIWVSSKVNKIEQDMIRHNIDTDEMRELVEHLHTGVQMMQRIAALIKEGETSGV